jgi:hypothetical protein
MKKVLAKARVVKYVKGVRSGLTKKESAIRAGFPDASNISKLEKTEAFMEVERHYRDALLDKITLDDVAEEHIKNIKQDEDRGAKNKAIEMYYNKVEPEKVSENKEDRVMVVLSSSK